MIFSIIVPAYKSSYLEDCIRSILNQTFEDFEVIIVDDASPNDVLSIVRLFDDKRIRYYRNDKGFGAYNLVDNWNKCLEYANGDYTICMGDDDMLEPVCLSEYYRLIVANEGCPVLHGRTKLIDQNGNILSLLEARDDYESIWANVFYRWKGRYQYIGDYCFNTKKLREKGGFYKIPLAWGSDDITVNIMARENGILNINIPVFNYRINPYTITSRQDGKTKIQSVIIEEGWYLQLLNDSACPEGDLYYNCVKEMFSNVFLKKKLECTISDLTAKKTAIFYWIKARKIYSLNWKMLSYAFIMAIIRGHINSYKERVR